MVSLPRYRMIFPDVDFTSPDAIAHAQQQLTDLLVTGLLAPPLHKETLDATRI
jgi:hypothetical protein